MNQNSRIQHLAGENYALRMMFTELCRALMMEKPNLALSIRGVFDRAEEVAELASLKFGGDDSATYLIAVTGVIEEVRGSLFEESGKPEHGI